MWVCSLILRGIASGPSQSTCLRSHASVLPCTIKDHPTPMQHHIPAPPALIWNLLEQGESWLLLWSTHVWNHIHTVQPHTFNSWSSRNKSIKTDHFSFTLKESSQYTVFSHLLYSGLYSHPTESPCTLIIYFTGIWSICISKGQPVSVYCILINSIRCTVTVRWPIFSFLSLLHPAVTTLLHSHLFLYKHLASMHFNMKEAH